MPKIKLQARLSAYSKVKSTEPILPNPTLADAGKFVGVGNNGTYTLFENATEDQIDDIVNNNLDTVIPTNNKSFIDSMFD